jgi:cytochrome oxidase Cu insertion factor (SCO1/SenC/PrrC family)
VNSTALPFWIAGAVLLVGLYAGWKLWEHESHEPLAQTTAASGPVVIGAGEGDPVTDFKLERSTGDAFHSKSLHGDVWVASFFFTTCPGSCTRLNTNIRMLQADEAIAGVKWVSISVDPVNDTTEALQRYAENFDADPERWHFLRGPLPDVRRIGQEIFKLPVNYQGHNDYGVVVDRSGVIRSFVNINSQRDREKLRELLVELLAEAPPEEPSELSGEIVREGLPPDPVAAPDAA